LPLAAIGYFNFEHPYFPARVSAFLTDQYVQLLVFCQLNNRDCCGSLRDSHSVGTLAASSSSCYYTETHKNERSEIWNILQSHFWEYNTHIKENIIKRTHLLYTSYDRATKQIYVRQFKFSFDNCIIIVSWRNIKIQVASL